MDVKKNILETVGNTPLVKLNKITKELPCDVYAKVEYFNPGNSTKDRMALKMVEVAEQEGRLKAGGIVFIKEIVPRRIVSLIANTIYKENYATHIMKHSWHYTEEQVTIEYYWKLKTGWNYIKATADSDPTGLIKDSEEEFITEHFWGYTFINNTCSGEYEVQHSSWRIHKVREYSIKCDAGNLFGEEFSKTFEHEPSSVFLAEGSPINVMKGTKIIARI